MPTPAPALDSLTLATGSWWHAALAGGLGVRCAIIAAVGVTVLVLALRAMHTMGRSGGSGGGGIVAGLRNLRGDRGTATVEFVLVFPVALIILLTLLQTMLLFSANLFVHYAAFCATRSAIVETPTGLPGGGAVISRNGDSYRAAKRAAAYALIPISGRSTGNAGGGQTFADGLSDYYRAYNQTPPNWVANLAAQRFNYAADNTTLQLYITTISNAGEVQIRPSDAGSIGYGPKDPLTLGVTHDIHLSIPYVSMIFADGKHTTANGDTPYATASATCTLTLEAADVNLPPKPTVERRP